MIDSTTTVSADSSFFQISATVIKRSRFIYMGINIKCHRLVTVLSELLQSALSLTLMEMSTLPVYGEIL